ncbi:S6 family peptidase, partial [Paralysiella testudinis]
MMNLGKPQYQQTNRLDFYTKLRSCSHVLLFLMAPLYISKSDAGVVRHDIDYNEYIKFAHNAGKYAAGSVDVQVYTKDGQLSTGSIQGDGSRSIPLMPDFQGVSDKGFATPVSHNIVVTAAHMKELYNNDTYGRRFYRSDLPLFHNSNEDKAANYLKFILPQDKIDANILGHEQDLAFANGAPYRNNEDIGFDTSIIRMSKMIFDAVPYGLVDSFSSVAVGDLIARNGAGVFIQPLTDPYTGTAVNVVANSYTYLHGSLADVKTINEMQLGQNVSYQLMPDAATVLDSSSMPGDSGSPVFWWDKDKQQWLLLGVNSQGGNNARGYGKIGIMQYLPNLTNILKNRTTTQEVSNNQTIQIENKRVDSFNDVAHFKFLSGQSEDATLDLYKHYALGSYMMGANPKVKDLYLKNNDKNGTVHLQINGDTDIGAIPLYFETNATIGGNGKFDLSGMSVAEGNTVTSTLTLAPGTDWRKVGKGTLRLQAEGRGHGSVAIGDGTLELANQGVAADKIMMATGQATVKLLGENQLNNNEIYFGVRGGKFDLNGHALNFNDIYHLDRGANIANDNPAQKSTFTFSANEERNYLGSFNGNLDVVYAPAAASESNIWHLRGDSNIQGELQVKQGRVNFVGDKLTYGTALAGGIGTTQMDYLRREWRPSTFQANSISVDKGAALGIGRAATVQADNITLAGNNRVSLFIDDAEANRHDSATAAVKGNPFLDPNFHNPLLKANLKFNGSGNSLNFNTPVDFTNTFTGGISGQADIHASGSGQAVWNNTATSVLQSRITTAADTALQINNQAPMDLTLTSPVNKVEFNNHNQATWRFGPMVAELGAQARINLAPDSRFTFAADQDSIPHYNVAVNGSINGIADGSILPQLTLAGGAGTFDFQQPRLNTDLRLQNGSLGLKKALTVAGNFEADTNAPLSTLVFGDIGRDTITALNAQDYEINNKLVIEGKAGGSVQPLFTLRDDVQAMLADPMKSLTFVTYKSGSLGFENAPRMVNKGLEFGFQQDNGHTYVAETKELSAAENAAAQAAAENAAAQAAAENAAAQAAAENAAAQAAAENAAAQAAAENAAAQAAAE